MVIPIGIAGDIVNSPRAGHQIRVVDDIENTGGYLVYEWWSGSDGPNPQGSFDSWVERYRLEQFFRESAWVVRWHQGR